MINSRNIEDDDKELFMFVHMSQWDDMVERFDTETSPSWTIATLLDIGYSYIWDKLLWNKVELLWIDESKDKNSKDLIKQKIEEYRWRVTILFSSLLYNSKNTIRFAQELRKKYNDQVNIVIWWQLTCSNDVKDSYKRKNVLWIKTFDAVTEWDWEILIPTIMDDILNWELKQEYIKYLNWESRKFNFSNFTGYHKIEEWIRERKKAWKEVKLTMQWLGWPGCSWAKFKKRPCNYCALQNITKERSDYTGEELEKIFLDLAWRHQINPGLMFKEDRITPEYELNKNIKLFELYYVATCILKEVIWTNKDLKHESLLNKLSQNARLFALLVKSKITNIVNIDVFKILLALYTEKILEVRFDLDEWDTIFDTWNNFIPYYRNSSESHKNIVDWLKTYRNYRNRLGIKMKKYIYLRVDYFDDKKEIARLLKEIWVREVYLWVEHFDPEMLTKMNKWDYKISEAPNWNVNYWYIKNAISQLDELGIKYRMWMVLWYESESETSLKKVETWIDFANNSYWNNLEEIGVFPIEIIPNSQVWWKFKWIISLRDFESFKSKIISKNLSDSKLKSIRDKSKRIFDFFAKNGYLTRRQQVLLQKYYINLMTDIWYDRLMDFALKMKNKYPNKVYWVDISLNEK